jgi:hypothetical protein
MNVNLTEFTARWRVPAVLAITLQSRSVLVDHVRRENGGSRVLKTRCLPIGADQLMEDPEQAGRALADLLKGEGLGERRCVVCLPASWVLSTSTELPEVSQEDLRSFLELRAEREFPFAAADLHLAYSVFESEPGVRNATLAALPSRKLEAVRAMLERAGCRPVSISLALEVGMSEEGRNEGGGLNVLVNGNHFDLVVMAGGGVAALRSVSAPEWGGEGGSGIDGDRIGRELRITLGRLPEDVRRRLAKARFVGERRSAEAVLEATQAQLHRLGLQGIVPASTKMSGREDPDAPAPGIAARVAERHLQGQQILFEFVAPETKAWHAFMRRYDTLRNRWIAAVALCCLVLPAVLLAVRTRIENRLAAEWNKLEPVTEELGMIQSRLREFRPWFETGTPSVEMLHGLVSAFPESGEVWAKRIELKEDAKVVCAGFARDQGVWMDFLDDVGAQPGVTDLNVQSVRGDRPVQFDLSFTWRRDHDR